MYSIVVHGGAGVWRGSPERPLTGVRNAAATGLETLAHGASALDAVVAAVLVLEDDPAFNAGTGSVLNLVGAVEMDAAVMAGKGLRAGGVAAIRRVRNPVAVARAVMEHTRHVLLAGEGASRFARLNGFGDYEPMTAERRAQWLERSRTLERAPNGTKVRRAYGLEPGTVGAVALDRNGELAAATSTGGTSLKLPGRVGDTPLPGAGNYATSHAAVSATGRGELMMRFGTARAVCDRIAAGSEPQAAVTAVLLEMESSIGAECGLIAIDTQGRIGFGHRTPAMPCAWGGEGRPVVATLASGA